MSEYSNVIAADKKYDVVNYMRNKFPDIASQYKDDNTGNKELYYLAKQYFTNWEFPEWDDSPDIYSQDASSIDTSPQAVNKTLSHREKVWQAYLKAQKENPNDRRFNPQVAEITERKQTPGQMLKSQGIDLIEMQEDFYR